jgi:two-component system LytT family response regulator
MKILIVDPNTAVRAVIKQVVDDVPNEQNDVFEAGSLLAGIKAIQHLSPDLVFTELLLPDGSGFELLDMFPHREFMVVALSNTDEHALKAIKYGVTDYLLKPLLIDEIEKSLKNSIKELKKKNRQGRNGYLNQESLAPHRIVVSTSEGIHLLNINEILHLQSFQSYTTFYLKGERKITVSKTLKCFEKYLAKFNFFRTHQSHLVNMESVSRISKEDGGFIVLENGMQIPVSRSKRNALMQLCVSNSL